MKYRVEITETLTRMVEVEADSKEDAESKVNDQYQNCEIVLNADDFVAVDFEVLN